MSESLIDIESGAAEGAAPAAQQAAAAGTAAPETPPATTAAQGTARVVEYNGERIEVPENFWDASNNAPNAGALLKAATDMRRQISAMPKAPDEYKVTVPENLSSVVEFNSDDPRWKQAVEWGKKHNIPAEAMQALVEIELSGTAQSVAAQAERRNQEMAALTQALGPSAEQEKQEIVRFVGNILGDKIKDQAIIGELSALSSTAAGVMVLKHFKDAVTRGGRLPMPGGDNQQEILTTDSLKKLQESDAYQNGDPATLKKVEEGYRRLYG